MSVEQFTLNKWRAQAVGLFGEESPAIKVLDERIEELGGDHLVSEDDVVIRSLFSVHMSGGNVTP